MNAAPAPHPPADPAAGLAGRVDAHTHLYSALAPYGLPSPVPPPRDFPGILGALWWRLDRALDEETLVAGARLYAAEALLAGTTGLIDHHESPHLIEGSLDLLADACESIGIRALLGYGATERNGGREEAEAGLGECRRFILSNRRPRVRGVMALHASFTVSDDTIREAGRLCSELGAVMHVHVAEDRSDVEDARRRGHAGPLERLFDLGALAPGSIAAHGVHLDEAQVRRCAASGVWLVQNPRSNANNGVGYAASLGASDLVALGTDGFPADLDAELAALRRLAREHHDPTTAGRLEARASAGGAMMIQHFGDAAGGDRVWFRKAGPDGRRVAERVTVQGQVVVDHGRLLTAEIGELRARARETAPALWRRMESFPWPV